MNTQDIKMEQIPVEELIRSALLVRKKAYAPYSSYYVGAALLTKEDRIYTGCNVENVAYSPTNCAERTAIFKAISEGKHQFSAIAVVGSPKGDVISQYACPCGVCRQVMSEFVNAEEFIIIVAKSITDYKVLTLKELLPESFEL